jgi:hypothetical protein
MGRRLGGNCSAVVTFQRGEVNRALKERRKDGIAEGRAIERKESSKDLDFLSGLTWYFRDDWDAKSMRKWIEEAKTGKLRMEKSEVAR